MQSEDQTIFVTNDMTYISMVPVTWRPLVKPLPNRSISFEDLVAINEIFGYQILIWIVVNRFILYYDPTAYFHLHHIYYIYFLLYHMCWTPDMWSRVAGPVVVNCYWQRLDNQHLPNPKFLIYSLSYSNLKLTVTPRCSVATVYVIFSHVIKSRNRILKRY